MTRMRERSRRKGIKECCFEGEVNIKERESDHVVMKLKRVKISEPGERQESESVV